MAKIGHSDCNRVNMHKLRFHKRVGYDESVIFSVCSQDKCSIGPIMKYRNMLKYCDT